MIHLYISPGLSGAVLPISFHPAPFHLGSASFSSAAIADADSFSFILARHRKWRRKWRPFPYFALLRATASLGKRKRWRQRRRFAKRGVFSADVTGDDELLASKVHQVARILVEPAEWNQ